MTNKQILDAQKVLSKWRGTPVKMLEEHGQTYWQITFDNETYGLMLNVVTSVAETPIKEIYAPTYTQTRSYSTFNPEADYRRDKI